MKGFAASIALIALTIVPADAQRRQQQPETGERPLRIGSWSGTVEVDAFTRKERIIVTSSRAASGLVLRCMVEKLSIGWIEGTLFKGPFQTGDTGELSLRVGDNIIGPFQLTALNDMFMAGDLSHADLSRIARASTEIGFRFSHDGVVQTGGVRAQRTAEVAARMKKSCPDDPPAPSAAPAQSNSSSRVRFVAPLRVTTEDPALVSEAMVRKAYDTLKGLCPPSGQWEWVTRVDVVAGLDTSDEAKNRGVRSSVMVTATTSDAEEIYEMMGGQTPAVFAFASAWRLLCGDKPPPMDDEGNVPVPALSFLP